MTSVQRNFFLGAVGLIVAGCASSWATSENWSKSGSTQEAAAESLRECTEQVDLALRTQANIDADITASREVDWRASGTYKNNVEAQGDSLSARRDRLIGRCMVMSGYLIDR